MNGSDPAVLIVDDEPDTCWALEHILKKYGVRCVRALNGRSALTAMGSNRLSLVLLDAKLPDMDGLEVARQMRMADADVPIVLVSGYFYRNDPVIQTALEQGWICDFVGKPFLHRDIQRAIETAFSCQREGAR